MKFSEIYGQEEIKSYLKSLVTKDKVPHALLFTGNRGNGKLALALALSSYIQCRDRSDGDSCGKCVACRKSMQHIHPDIHYVVPTISSENKSIASSSFIAKWREILSEKPYFTLSDWSKQIDAGNKKPNIPKVSIFELIKAYGLKTFEGNKKISIIWEAELLGKEGNRLLKLIEEPPENSVFILVSDQPDKLLNTIISRCQIINIPPFTDENLKDFSREKLGTSGQELEDHIRVANGDIIELHHLINKSNKALNDQFFDWLRMAYRAKAADVINWADTFYNHNKDNQLYFYKFGLSFFEQYLRSFSLDDSRIRLSGDALIVAEKMKSVLNPEQAMQIIELINDCLININRNANVKLQMINSSLTLHKIMTKEKA